MKKEYWLDLFKTSMAACIVGVGCTFFLAGAIGADPMTTFSQGLSILSNSTFSIPYYGLNMAMFVGAYCVDKKQIGWGTLVFSILSAVTINVTSLFMPVITSYARYIVFFIGMVLIALAVSIVSKVTCGKNPYDALLFSLTDKYDIAYAKLRIGFDAIMLIGGILLGATWGIGTVISVLCTGIIAQWFMHIMYKK